MTVDLINKILKDGPTRVVYNESGSATIPGFIEKEHFELSPIVYIRHDGWSLGAVKGLEKVAYDLWKDDWIGQINIDLGEFELFNKGK